MFVDFIKLKSETLEALKRIRAHFDATVAVPVDAEGHPMPRPTAKWIHSDREGALLTQQRVQEVPRRDRPARLDERAARPRPQPDRRAHPAAGWRQELVLTPR